MRLLKALGALIALGTLLVGVPWFLLRFVPLAHLLTADWVAALTVGADARLILALLGVLGWAAWAVLAATIVFEAVAVLSRERIRLRMPGTGWLQPVVSALIVAAIATPGVASADTAAPPLESVAVVGAQEPTAQHVRSAPSAQPETRRYVVQPGDELWAVAEAELGSGERWRQIVELNPDLAPESRLAPGTFLLLPAEQQEPVVVVEEGDTLWHIAAEELGDPTRWPEIHAANSDTITDPDEIEVGWQLTMPAPAVAVEPAETSAAPAEEAPAEERPALPMESPEGDIPEDDLPEGAGPGAGVPGSGATQADPDVEARAALAVSEAFGAGFRAREGGFPSGAEASASRAIDALPTDSQDIHAGEAADDTDEAGLLAPVGAALASAVLMGIGTRRRAQLLARAVGRRLVPVPQQVARWWTALARRADEETSASSPESPTALVLGWDGEEPVELDVEAERAVVFTGSEATSALAAALTGLSCAPHSAGVEVLVVDGDDWAAALDDPRISGEPSTDSALSRLMLLCSERRLALRHRSLAEVRADADLAEGFPPVVAVFMTPLTPTQLDTLHDILALGRVGVAALLGAPSAVHLPLTHVAVEEHTARLRSREFTPQLVTQPARRALVELFAATTETHTEPAPWWRTDDDLPPNVHPLPWQDHTEERTMPPLSCPAHPTLLLLGAVEITGAAGTVPNRATGQCMEYLTWLLQHPGATPTRMLRDLQVADTTRRSNMSRLRAWLGSAPDGARYLPDAYSGRLVLDERVTSDWERFAAVLTGGVNVASSAALREALEMVRGEPMGAFAFQWHWAQQLRADMVAMIVDAACVLTDRALAHDDTHTAMWAVGQGKHAAPLDDSLAVREIETLHRAGRHSEAEQAIIRLNRVLRAEGRDLDPLLATRAQQAVAARARRAASASQA